MPELEDAWTYPARPAEHTHPLGVVDGDTVDVLLDKGIHSYDRITVRLDGIDTAEIYGPDASERGDTHAAFVEEWMEDAVVVGDGWPLTVQTIEPGKYNERWIGTIENYAGERLADALFDEFGDEVADD